MNKTPLLLLLASIAPAFAQLPDKPTRANGKQQVDALIAAEAPYIAKGKATYPAAKKRFLAGLPAGQEFSVRRRLVEDGGKTREEVFVYVDAIKGGVVYGEIASEIRIAHSYHQGQKIKFPESEVLDWMIRHPDGTEEGNVVGRFIDHYKAH